MLTLKDMSEIVGVPEALLRVWLDAGKIKATTTTENILMMGSETVYYFTEKDIEPIRTFANKSAPKKPEVTEQFVDDGEQEFFTVRQIALLWQLSTDTIQRLFENEPGVLPLGKNNPRGKRKRITLRIPRAVMERVRKRRSNS